MQKLRAMDLFKAPGVAETLDWASTLVELNQTELTAATVDTTLGVVLKYQDDIARLMGDESARLLMQIRAGPLPRRALR